MRFKLVTSSVHTTIVLVFNAIFYYKQKKALLSEANFRSIKEIFE